ncbi:hypothetical protein Poli38472_006078 [Pythium oligandrum]|uniref:subtilisin n=1 Tax=Pythium oligandrum TaxID=41045 RepID=A0A8K1FLT7_PYTOL|nr:hypothetical protein Poli38472_006078 [Pythium oligandrum]|eukprot:TMW68610.1 hypothetical protein Poli38472_006078 [Pythium oligandrum]
MMRISGAPWRGFPWTLALLALYVGYASALHAGSFSSASYRRLAQANGDEIVPFVVGLRPRDFETLEERLWSVSDPRNPNYGRHLTKEDVDALAAPHPRDLEGVQQWITERTGISAAEQPFSRASNMLKVSVPARALEELLKTEIHMYEKTTNPRSRLLKASRPVSIPAHLSDAIAFVNVNSHPMELRALAAPSPSARELKEAAYGSGKLAQIRQLYGIPDDLVVTNTTNLQATPSFYTEAWSPEDLKMFYKQFLPDDPVPSVVEKGARENIPSAAGIEASLDVQYLTGVARNTTTQVWTMNGSNPYSSEDEPFVEFVQAILEQEKPPFVVSISYSDDEEHIFKICPDYARFFDTLLIKMGLRGITVLLASGDDGVAGLRPEFAKLTPDEACLKSGPQWPSASPYVTAVGATMQLSPQEYGKPFFQTSEEVICSGEVGGVITTGGGFSNVYAMPAYQRSLVSHYLRQTSRLPKTKGFFNASGRAYPDISALGAAFNVVMHGRTTSVSGTSASTPVIGGMVTLWNDMRLNAGKSTLGFINPLIYYLAEHEPLAFNDVVIGNNGHSKRAHRSCDDWFGAAPGWDAVSGVGTPNFQVISAFIRGLEDRFNLTANASSVTCGDTGNITDTPVNLHSSSPLNGTSTIQKVLIVGAILAAVALGILLFLWLIKRCRNQYTSLSSESPHVNAGSPDSSPSRGRVTSDSPGIEMCEISLRD